MPKVSFKFEGGKELEAALAQLGSPSTMKRTAERALKRAAEPIRDEAIRLAPEDTGDLKESIKIGKAGRGGRTKRRDVAETFVGIDGSKNKRLFIYAGVDEFGSSDTPAQPYMRPAFETKKQEAVDRVSDDLRAEIDKSAQRLSRRANKKALKAAGG